LLPTSEATHGLNLQQEFIRAMAQAIGEHFDSASPLPKILSGESMFSYIYSILHSPEYRSRYCDFLKIDYARIPLPSSKILFATLAGLGERLIALHLLASPSIDRPVTTYTGPKNPEVDRVGWSKNTVWLDAGKT